jgi:photosystem II stability/assembly factor-like uncharacterized protein
MKRWLYVGIAGDTDPGRFYSAGLYRSADGDGAWESISAGFPKVPQVRSIVTDPARPGVVTVATQYGIFRSDDFGDRWRRLGAPEPMLAVWSLGRHPTDPRIMFAGYEPFAIYRTTDDGATWEDLKVEVSFPDVSLHPVEMPKRATAFAFDANRPDEVYVSIEIGGLLHSPDGGRTWRCLTDGLYINEDAVDLHSVVVDPRRPGVVTAAARIGTFRSTDGGAHWRDLAVPLLRPRGSYCRALAFAPDDSETIYLGAGNDFDGDTGALFITRDNGRSWSAPDLGTSLKCTIFAVAVDLNHPDDIYCASKYGQVFLSHDRGATWRMSALPRGAGHVYALAAE